MLARIGYEHINNGNTHGVLRNNRITIINDLPNWQDNIQHPQRYLQGGGHTHGQTQHGQTHIYSRFRDKLSLLRSLVYM